MHTLDTEGASPSWLANGSSHALASSPIHSGQLVDEPDAMSSSSPTRTTATAFSISAHNHRETGGDHRKRSRRRTKPSRGTSSEGTASEADDLNDRQMTTIINLDSSDEQPEAGPSKPRPIGAIAEPPRRSLTKRLPSVTFDRSVTSGQGGPQRRLTDDPRALSPRRPGQGLVVPSPERAPSAPVRPTAGTGPLTTTTSFRSTRPDPGPASSANSFSGRRRRAQSLQQPFQNVDTLAGRRRVGSLSIMPPSARLHGGESLPKPNSPLPRMPSSGSTAKGIPTRSRRTSMEERHVKEAAEDKERERERRRAKRRRKRTAPTLDLGFERHLAPSVRDTLNAELDRIPASDTMLFYTHQQYEQASGGPSRQATLPAPASNATWTSPGTSSHATNSPELRPQWMEPFVAKAPPALTQASPVQETHSKARGRRVSQEAAGGDPSAQNGSAIDAESDSDIEDWRAEPWQMRRVSNGSSDAGASPTQEQAEVTRMTGAVLSKPRRNKSLKNPFTALKKRKSASHLPRVEEEAVDPKQLECDFQSQIEKALYELPSHPRTAELARELKDRLETYYRQLYAAIESPENTTKVLRWKQSLIRNGTTNGSLSVKVPRTPLQSHNPAGWSESPESMSKSPRSPNHSATSTSPNPPAGYRGRSLEAAYEPPISSGRSSRSQDHWSLSSSLARLVQKRQRGGTVDDILSRSRSTGSHSLTSSEGRSPTLERPIVLIETPPSSSAVATPDVDNVLDFARPIPRSNGSWPGQRASDGESTPRRPASEATSESPSVIPPPQARTPHMSETERAELAKHEQLLQLAAQLGSEASDGLEALDSDVQSLVAGYHRVGQVLHSAASIEVSAIHLPPMTNGDSLLRSLSQKDERYARPRRGSVNFRRRPEPLEMAVRQFNEDEQSRLLVSFRGQEYRDPIEVLQNAIQHVDDQFANALPKAEEASKDTDKLYTELSAISHQARSASRTGQSRRDMVSASNGARRLDFTEHIAAADCQATKGAAQH